MNTLISFATGHYKPCQARLNETAKPWFDNIVTLGPDDLDGVFTRRHSGQLRYKRGWGFWVWKPWVILERLVKMAPGDTLMYCDSQCVFKDDPTPLFELCHKLVGVLLFHQKREGHKNRTWTTGDCFALMACNGPCFWDGPQLNLALTVWAPTQKAIDLVQEWYGWCSDMRVNSDRGSTMPNLPEFKDHRHDQSILSLLAIRDSIETFPDPSQFGNGYDQPGRTYDQIISIDRMVGQCYPIPCPLPG